MTGPLGVDPALGVPLPDLHALPDPRDDDDAMARAMTPLVSARWDAAGRTTRERLGLDPGEWSVVDPRTAVRIDHAALNFCAATNQTTRMQLGQALDRLRRELHAGIVDRGDSLPELTRRVQSVFDGAERHRARRIAATEASRAVHDASLESARQSGVVSGKKLLVGANACPTCHAVAALFRAGAPLDATFLRHDDAPEAYRDVRMPPIHPYCRCSIEYVLTDEYADIAEGTGPGPLGPEAPGAEDARLKAEEARRGAEAEDARLKAEAEAEERRRRAKEEARAEEEAARKAEEEAERKRREAEARKKAEAEAEARKKAEAEARKKAEAERRAKEEAERRAKEEAERRAREAKEEARGKAEARGARPPGRVLPGRPIAERLKADAYSAEKVRQLATAKGKLAELRRKADDLDRESQSLASESASRGGKLAPKKRARLEELGPLLEEARDAHAAEKAALSGKVQAILDAPDPVKVRFRYETADKLGFPLHPLSPEQRAKADAAEAWLSRVIERGEGPDEFRPRVSAIPPEKQQRDHHVEGSMYLSDHTTASIAVHEAGHALDYLHATDGVKIGQRSVEFLNHRVGDEPPRRLNEVLPGSKYGDDERGRADKFGTAFGDYLRWYAGKDYGTNEHSEILSMGIEKLVSDPVQFAMADPEYCQYVIGILHGTLR